MEPKVIDCSQDKTAPLDFLSIIHRIGGICGFLALSSVGIDVGHFWAATVPGMGAGLCLGSVLWDLWAARPWK